MAQVNSFFFTYLAFKNITVTNVILIFSTLNNQKIIQFAYAQF
jgi:hypothetical protein